MGTRNEFELTSLLAHVRRVRSLYREAGPMKSSRFWKAEMQIRNLLNEESSVSDPSIPLQGACDLLPAGGIPNPAPYISKPHTSNKRPLKRFCVNGRGTPNEYTRQSTGMILSDRTQVRVPTK